MLTLFYYWVTTVTLRMIIVPLGLGQSLTLKSLSTTTTNHHPPPPQAFWRILGFVVGSYMIYLRIRNQPLMEDNLFLYTTKRLRPKKIFWTQIFLDEMVNSGDNKLELSCTKLRQASQLSLLVLLNSEQQSISYKVRHTNPKARIGFSECQKGSKGGL